LRVARDEPVRGLGNFGRISVICGQLNHLGFIGSAVALYLSKTSAVQRIDALIIVRDSEDVLELFGSHSSEQSVLRIRLLLKLVDEPDWI
jgi:hypothetical protein